MFVKYPYIPNKHKSVMTQVIRVRSDVTEAVLADLYKVCDEIPLNGRSTTPGVNASCVMAGSYTLATATDEKTGIYIQLAKGSPGPLLTVGQRWSMEGFDTATNTVYAKIWS